MHLCLHLYALQDLQFVKAVIDPPEVLKFVKKKSVLKASTCAIAQ